MKKHFIFALVLLFALSTPVMAKKWGTPPGQDKSPPGYYQHDNGNIQHFPNGHPGNPSQWTFIGGGDDPAGGGQVNVSGTYVGLAEGWDFSKSRTGWWGGFNDFGKATANGWTYGFQFNTGSGDSWRFICWTVPAFAFELGVVDLLAPELHAWSWAKDFGLMSKAGAGAKLEGSRGDAYVGGIAEGIKGDKETTYSKVGLGGSLYQENGAAETQYSSTYASGGNSSGLEFAAYNDKYDDGRGWADSHEHGISGDAITKGKTEVRVDPFGFNRSAYAHTENMSEINVNAEEFTGVVYGGGGVNAAAGYNFGSDTFGAGSASFNFIGGTAGGGQATMNVQIGIGHVNVSGSSSAYAVGDAPPANPQ